MYAVKFVHLSSHKAVCLSMRSINSHFRLERRLIADGRVANGNPRNLPSLLVPEW